MKKSFILMAAALMAFVSGCAVDEPAISLSEDSGIPMTFVATCNADQAETKTTYNETDGKVYWAVGDEIGIYYGDSRVAKFKSEATEPSRTATFTGNLSYSTSAGSYFWAVSPYSAANYFGYNTYVRATLPSTQTVGTSTFCPDAALMVARSANQTLSFKNVYSGLRFTLSKEGIKSIVFKPNGTETIAGLAKISFDEGGIPVVDSPEGNQVELIPASGTFETGKYYYLLFYPATLADGFTLSFSTDAGTGVFSHTSSVSFGRNQIREVQNIDSGVTFSSLDAIPDPAFRAYVLANFDTDHDGVLSDEEKNKVTRINLSTDNVSSMTGLGLFPNLTNLTCSGSSSGKGQLTEIDLSHNTALTYLNCSNNKLTALDVSGLSDLKTLSCSSNQLTTLNASGLTNLTRLNCGGNKISSLSVAGCTALVSLSCASNQLTALDVSNITTLESLSCSNNKDLSSLIVTGCTALESLSCDSDQLTSLDVSGLTSLNALSCNNNKLSSLIVTGCLALESLSCRDNQLTALDVSNLPALKKLTCYYNEDMTSLTVSGSNALTEIWCFSNNLSALDVSGLTALTLLSVGGNNLSSLVVTDCTELTELTCWGNNLSSLDVSNNLKLQTLDCGSYGDTLTKIIMKTGQVIASLTKPDSATIEYI